MTIPIEESELVLPRSNYAWEQPLLQRLQEIISGSETVHGVEHALAVVNSAYELSFEPEFRERSIDREILIAAGYLHDIGYAHAGSFSKDTFEHVAYGIEMTREILGSLSEFDPSKIEGVVYLILNHDNAKLGVPNHHLGDRPRLTPDEIRLREETKDEGLRMALCVLKEADSREYTDISGTKRTFEYGQARSFPLIVERKSPSPHDPLNLCTLSNLLLFPHLAWLNATTAKGKLLAAKGYLAAEQWVFNYCHEHGIYYNPDHAMEEIHWALKNNQDLVPTHLQ